MYQTQSYLNIKTNPMRCLGKDITTTVNNLSVSYNDEGSDADPVIIFIHGFPLNKSMWDGQLQVFKDNYRVIAYDIRGHGNSDAGEEDFSIDLFVNDLICFMDTLQIDHAALCGLSMGGYIALAAVSEYPERFTAVILSDTQCTADSFDTKEKRIVAIESINHYGLEKYTDESIRKLFAPESIPVKKEEIAAVREMIMTTSKASLCNTLKALSARKEACAKLQAIGIPALIMAGADDIITPPASARLMHSKIEHSFLHIIEHAGHLSNMENPSEFNHQLKKFAYQSVKKQIHFLELKDSPA